jgi:hypothetical protein
LVGRDITHKTFKSDEILTNFLNNSCEKKKIGFILI